MTIDKPMVPRIPEPPLGDPCGGDGGGSGKRKIREGTMRGSRSMWERSRDGTRRGSRSMWERRRDCRRGGRTGHARYAAEEPEVWRRNPRDGTWRRSCGVPQPEPVTSAQGGLWRPWEAQEETEEIVSIIVSVADPDNHNHPEHFPSTDFRTRSQLQRGK